MPYTDILNLKIKLFNYRILELQDTRIYLILKLKVKVIIFTLLSFFLCEELCKDNVEQRVQFLQRLVLA